MQSSVGTPSLRQAPVDVAVAEALAKVLVVFWKGAVGSTVDADTALEMLEDAVTKRTEVGSAL